MIATLTVQVRSKAGAAGQEAGAAVADLIDAELRVAMAEAGYTRRVAGTDNAYRIEAEVDGQPVTVSVAYTEVA